MLRETTLFGAVGGARVWDHFLEVPQILDEVNIIWTRQTRHMCFRCVSWNVGHKSELANQLEGPYPQTQATWLRIQNSFGPADLLNEVAIRMFWVSQLPSFKRLSGSNTETYKPEECWLGTGQKVHLLLHLSHPTCIQSGLGAESILLHKYVPSQHWAPPHYYTAPEDKLFLNGSTWRSTCVRQHSPSTLWHTDGWYGWPCRSGPLTSQNQQEELAGLWTYP